ncbi:hypothetical protein AX15_006776 [Amanita polypyramis BW_CC]|nr:hypothetical protein AX15_006776 [Amanita polypyramis BW_CC]
MLQMNATYLRGLKRSELQKLAREHKVKANLKSDVIIDVLLQRYTDTRRPRTGGRTPTTGTAPAPRIKVESRTPTGDTLEMPPAPVPTVDSNSQILLVGTTGQQDAQVAQSEAVNSGLQEHPKDTTSQQVVTAVISESEVQIYSGGVRSPPGTSQVPEAAMAAIETERKTGCDDSPSPPGERSSPALEITNELQLDLGDARSRSLSSLAVVDMETRVPLRSLLLRKGTGSDDSPVGQPAPLMPRIHAAPLDDEFFRQFAQTAVNNSDPRHYMAYPGSPPDHSAREEPPAEELVKGTVQMIAEIEKENHTMMERIVKLRAAAAELRSRAKVVRAVVRAEDANRVRMMTYLTYWQPIHEAWEWREVWSGEMKVRDDNDFVGVTSSDEEDIGDDKSGEERGRPTTNEQHVPLRQASGEVSPDKENLDGPNPPPDANPANAIDAAKSSNVVAGQKRPRERDTEDTNIPLGYHHRAEENNAETPERASKRFKAELLSPLYNYSPPPTPTPKRAASKGKEKMSAEQVQVLENERAAERLSIEIAEPIPYSLYTAHRHGNGESSAQTQRVVSDLANEQPVALSKLDPPMLGFTLDPNGPLYNAKSIAGQKDSFAPPDHDQNIETIPDQPRPTRWSTRKRKRED